MQIINWTQLHIIILILQNCYGLIVDDTDSNEDIMRLDVSSESDTKKRNREATI